MGKTPNNNKNNNKTSGKSKNININADDNDNIDEIGEIDDSEYDSYPSISNTASASEMTGLMYAPPQNEEELESYKDLFSMPIPKKKEKAEKSGL